jgi:hypothetical protein
LSRETLGGFPYLPATLRCQQSWQAPHALSVRPPGAERGADWNCGLGTKSARAGLDLCVGFALDSPAMTTSRLHTVLGLSVLALSSAALLVPGTSEAAGKPAAKAKAAKGAKPAAKPKAEPASSSESKPSSTPYETPSPGQPETPPAAAGEGAKPAEASAKPTESSSKSGETSSSSTEASTSEAPKEPTPEPAPSEPSLPQETTIPPVVDTAPPTEPAPLYVEHLGPNSYPGKLRGIYGGSLWLEPSFHGLQWPYMTRSGVGVSGWLWIDSGYERVTRDRMGDTVLWLQQGRGVLRVTPTYTNGSFFIQGQVELVGNVCQVAGTVCTTEGTFDTDDLWIRFGQWNAWDLKVGRFEAWELYHTGMGLDLNTLERRGASNFGMNSPAGLSTPDFYGMNWMHDRPASGLGVGYIAFHAYPTNNFRLEMLGELGADSLGQDGMAYIGARPALILDQGWMKAKVGAEYERGAGDTGFLDGNNNGAKTDSKKARTRRGFGGTLQFVIDPRAEFGGNFAYGDQKFTPSQTSDTVSATDSFTRISVGGFANVRVGALWLLGVGANFTWQNDTFYASGSPSPDYTAHLQGFLALQYLLARQLYIKAVFGYARADFVASDATVPVLANYMYSGRLRLMYLY